VRILLLAQLYPPIIGGEERHVRNLAIELAGRGHEVHVGTFATDAGEPQRDPGVTVHSLDNIGRRYPQIYPVSDRPLALPVPDPFAVRSLGQVVKQVDPDVVHAHNWIANSYLALPSAYRRPFVLSLHDYSHVCANTRMMRQGEPCSGPSRSKCPPCAASYYGRGRGQAVWGAVRTVLPVRRRAVDLFTPVSRYVAKANGLEDDGSRFEVVPNFVPDSLLEVGDRGVPRDPILPQGPYLFFAGDVMREKGVTTLVEAYRRLPEATRPALVVVGRPVDPVPEVPGLVVHQGWPHERVVSGFHHALAAVLPSEVPDACPTTVLEAMALGAPLVTTHRGGIADMVEPERSALVVPAADPARLSEALARVVDDAELRERLRAGGRERVKLFVQSAVAERLEGLYADVVARDRAAS
jgi:glycosyltransferase involved in cell wall biosynthesis